MNCKKGDLAVVVYSAAGNEGRIVLCVRLHQSHRMLKPDGSIEEGPCWEMDRALMGWRGRTTQFVLDWQLRPLRDQPGADETLTWAGKPASKELERA